jgi:alpha-N-arabinofuranosidase
MILTDQGKMVLTPTYYVFKMYRVHQDATLIPIEIASPTSGGAPMVTASASKDSSGRLHISLVNLDPSNENTVDIPVRGFKFTRVTGETLTGPITAMNTFETPRTIAPRPFNAYRIESSEIHVTLPAASVTVLELQ